MPNKASRKEIKGKKKGRKFSVQRFLEQLVGHRRAGELSPEWEAPRFNALIEGVLRAWRMGKVGFGLAVSCAAATCAIAAILVGKRVRSRRKWRRVVGVLKDLEEACETSVGRLKQVVDAMAVEMHAGLASEGGSKLKMLLTFVDKLPNG